MKELRQDTKEKEQRALPRWSLWAVSESRSRAGDDPRSLLTSGQEFWESHPFCFQWRLLLAISSGLEEAPANTKPLRLPISQNVGGSKEFFVRRGDEGTAFPAFAKEKLSS